MSNIVKVWYISNHELGRKLFSQIEDLRIQTVYFDIAELSKINPLQEHTNVFIFDLVDLQTNFIVNIVTQDERFKNSLKLCILSKKQISEFASKTYNSFKLELLQRPVNNEMFLLLLEKSVLVELYKDFLRSNSLNSSNPSNNNRGIHSFEIVMEINRKHVLEACLEKKLGFNSIIEFQSHLKNEQAKLRKKIKKMHFGENFVSEN